MHFLARVVGLDIYSSICSRNSVKFTEKYLQCIPFLVQFQIFLFAGLLKKWTHYRVFFTEHLLSAASVSLQLEKLISTVSWDLPLPFIFRESFLKAEAPEMNNTMDKGNSKKKYIIFFSRNFKEIFLSLFNKAFRNPLNSTIQNNYTYQERNTFKVKHLSALMKVYPPKNHKKTHWK